MTFKVYDRKGVSCGDTLVIEMPHYTASAYDTDFGASPVDMALATPGGAEIGDLSYALVVGI
jgi:hypothetical protein